VTVRSLAFLASRKFVVALNGLVLLFCALSIIGILPLPAGATLIARAIPAIPPIITCIFLLIWRSSTLLAALALVANLLELALGLLLQLIVLLNDNHPLYEIPPSIQELMQRFLILFASVVVPLFSVAAVTTHKPVSPDGFFARPIAAFWLTTFGFFWFVAFFLVLLGIATMGHGGNGGNGGNFLGYLFVGPLVIAVPASLATTALVAVIVRLFRRSP
jgi:hypothetical protein